MDKTHFALIAALAIILGLGYYGYNRMNEKLAQATHKVVITEKLTELVTIEAKAREEEKDYEKAKRNYDAMCTKHRDLLSRLGIRK